MNTCIIITSYNNKTLNSLEKLLGTISEINCIFLIFDAVQLSQDQDFINLLKNNKQPAILCSSACERRSIKDFDQNVFSIASIAHFVDKADQADNVVQL